MTEKLAIKTDKTSRWNARNPRAGEDLAPRPGEAAKSAWAFQLPDKATIEDLFEDAERPRASRVLQALNLFLLADATVSRNKVSGVQIPRGHFPANSVTEDRSDHLCAHHDSTHRSLPSNEGDRSVALEQCFQSKDGDNLAWAYAAFELVGLASALLDRESIREAYIERTLRLIESYTGIDDGR